MRTWFIFITFMLLVSSVTAQESTFTASTPAGVEVRNFLNIPLNDSVDFIRWQLILRNNAFTLKCNYGIGKPNTNGFINGGNTLSFNGTVIKEKTIYKLIHGNKTLHLVELNNDLLQMLGKNKRMLVGNGGWSYTLNNVHPQFTVTNQTSSAFAVIKDSLALEGRTPCGVPGIIPQGKKCYKLKWYIVLYANSKANNGGTFKIAGTPYRAQGGKTGTWKMTGTNGKIVYHLLDGDQNTFIDLQKVDDNIFVFTDMHDKPLVGNEDFSYTLNGIVKK